MPEDIDYVSADTARFDVIRAAADGSQKTVRKELLWGDRVVIRGPGRDGTEKKVAARGQTGFVARTDLGGDPLLELYFIDVGQGDGILICTPDRRHILIDGGWPRRNQPTGKNAADFVAWKFTKDYRLDRIELDAVICSHNDQDHYGGLWDLFDPEQHDELGVGPDRVFVERFYHAGLSWWKKNNKGWLGRTVDTADGTMFIDLIGSRTSVKNALAAEANPRLHGEWAAFLEAATGMRTKAGTLTPFQRLSHVTEYVPGFEPGPGGVSIRVLAPVEFDAGGKPAIRYFPGGPSKNTNGNSVLLRIDYGRTRTLLTGDLNTRSQAALLQDWEGERHEFQCDVAKACHHGSDDVSYAFLQALQPAVTVISSGDAEGHDHPRPAIVGASATTGYLKIEDDVLVSPLIYSTEIARSLKLGLPTALRLPLEGGGLGDVPDAALGKAEVSLAVTNAGDRNPSTRKARLARSRVVAGLIYGLVNVRTDGSRILCATMNEAKHTWQVKTLQSRF